MQDSHSYDPGSIPGQCTVGFVLLFTLCRASPVFRASPVAVLHRFAVLHRLKNSEAVYPACRKRRLLGTYQLQSDC